MEEIDYERMNGKIAYSEEFKKLSGKNSIILGFRTASDMAREVENKASHIAINSGVYNNYYCETLALANYIGLPAYGMEGREVLDEMFNGNYSQAEINIKVLKKLLGKVPEKLQADLRSLENGDLEQMSNEARCVYYAQEILENINLLTETEKQKLGGVTLGNVLVEDLKLDENGALKPGSFYQKVNNAMKKRKGKRIESRRERAKNFFDVKITDAITDEQEIEKILEK